MTEFGIVKVIRSILYATRFAIPAKGASVLVSLLFLAALILMPSVILAQATNAIAISNGPIVNQYGTVAANAPVRVCLASAIGIPCSTSGVTLYSDINLTVPITNPTTTNSQGIITAFTASGFYIVQVTTSPSSNPYIYWINPSNNFQSGAYSATITYSVGNIVSYSDNSYASLINDNTGNTPSSSPSAWGLLVSLSNLPTAFASQSASTPDSGTFTQLAANDPLVVAPGIVNDACYPGTGGGLTTYHFNGSACVPGAPTDNCTALTTLANTPGHWILPGLGTGPGGAIYTSCTPVIKNSGTVISGAGGGWGAGVPHPGTTVLEVLDTSGIDGLDVNCTAANCTDVGITDLNILAADSSANVGDSTAYGYNITGANGHSGNTYYTYRSIEQNVEIVGFAGGNYVFNSANGTMRRVQVIPPEGGSCTTIAGTGSESWILEHLSCSPLASSASNGPVIAAGTNLGSGSTVGLANYFECGDSEYSPCINLGDAAGTNQQDAFFDMREVEGQLVPNTVGNDSYGFGRFAGNAGNTLSSGSYFQLLGHGGLAMDVAAPNAYTPLLATDTVVAGTPVASTTSGTLAAGTYYYILRGSDDLGNTTPSSNEVTCVLSSTGNCQLPFTLPITVNQYPGIAVYRGTTSGGELYLHTFYNITNDATGITDGGTYTPSGAIPAAAYYHPFIDSIDDSTFGIYGPRPYIQLQNNATAASSSPWLASDSNGEVGFAWDNGCTEVPYGVSWNVNAYMRGECFYTWAKYSSGVSDTTPQWAYRNAAGTMQLTPTLANPTGTGAVVLANSPTTTNLSDTGTISATNLTVSGTCTGCTGTVTPQSQTVVNGSSGTIASGTYVSGGTISGTASETCDVTFSNGTTAVVALTGSDTIADGTAFTSVSGGSSIVQSLTSATLSSGTATCSGSATVTSVLASSLTGTGSFATAYSITMPAIAAGQCISYTAYWARAGTYNAVMSAEWIIGSTTIEPVGNSTSTNDLPWSSTVRICNNTGSTTAQMIYSSPVINNLSISGAQNATLGTLNTGSQNTITFSLSYATTDNYNLLGVTVGYGN